MIDVYLNDKFIGTVENKQFIEDFKIKRRKGEISKESNINYNEDLNEIHIDIDKGRCRRPLIIVDNGVSRLTDKHLELIEHDKLKWDEMVEQGIIEYLDASEEENAYVALYPENLTKEHTHLEISPVTILGLCTSLVPYSNFGSSSRLIRGSKIQKQSIGIYSKNYQIRLDTDVSTSYYPQRPIVKTFMHDVFKYDEYPSGQNLTIAVMSYEGYNMQDAIILNKGSIQRGLARSTFYKPYSIEELRYSGGLTDEISIPDKEVKGYRSEKDYRLLEEDGIIYPGASTKEEDVIIGKTSPPRFLSSLEEFSVAASTRRESSSALGEGESGIIDTIILTENEEGNRLVQVKIRKERIPELGDKFASRHGQKGVIGLLVPHYDMPYSSSGIVPDLIFSPHSIPGRMTVSHLLEILAGKVGAITGKCIDATAFDTPPEEDLRKTLSDAGFREDGTETFYNGITGQRFKAKIYVGNIYYLKLKHMAANKLHARASGRVQLLTRQPVEGRAMGGGLRLGEMEKDCLVAHGTSLLLKERFDSDKTIFHICESCGMFAMYDNYKNKATCSRCGTNPKISTVEMSYAFKLLLDEIRALGINSKINLKDKF
ncbi:MAG: DNA-directed RNA polymerase subunit B [Candidatus Woesearchaeota archaeon]